MSTKTMSAEHLPDILGGYPWDDERYMGPLWLCRKSDGNQSDRTLYCLVTPKGKTGLYYPIGGSSHKATVRPHDRKHATLVLEYGAPEVIERLKVALATNGWKNVVMRP
jgi:hypothetical protein